MSGPFRAAGGPVNRHGVGRAAADAAGSAGAEAVVAKTKATPISDFHNTNVKPREDGGIMHQMDLWQVKKAPNAKYGFREKLATIAMDEALRPLGQGGRPLTKA